MDQKQQPSHAACQLPQQAPPCAPVQRYRILPRGTVLAASLLEKEKEQAKPVITMPPASAEPLHPPANVSDGKKQETLNFLHRLFEIEHNKLLVSRMNVIS